MPSTSVEAQLRTRAFARVIGPFLATVTAVIAIRLPEMGVLSNNLFANPVMVWMLAALMLAGGLVIIAGHRNWRGPLAVTVSLFGWFVALRGLLLLATRQRSARASTSPCSPRPLPSWPGSSSAP